MPRVDLPARDARFLRRYLRAVVAEMTEMLRDHPGGPARDRKVARDVRRLRRLARMFRPESWEE